MRGLLSPLYVQGVNAPRRGHNAWSLLNVGTGGRGDDMDEAVERSKTAPDRGRRSNAVNQGKFDPSVMNTEQEVGLVDTPIGSFSARDAVFGMMPDKMGALSSMALSSLQSAFGPHAVDNMYGAPSLEQVRQAQTQQAYDVAAARNAHAGLFGNPNITPQAQFGNQAAPVNPGFMSHADLTTGLMEPEPFGGVMDAVEGDGGRGYGGPGRDASGDGMGGYGGPEGVGRDNARGGGIGF